MPLVEVTYQGAVVVNADNVREKRYDEVALIMVDLATKNCDILAHGSNHDIIIVPTEYSTGLNPNEKDKTKATSIKISGYDGWHIFMSEIVRYTLKLCLVKEEPSKQRMVTMTYGCPKCGWSIDLDKFRKLVMSHEQSEAIKLFKCPECGHPIPCDILEP